MAYYRDNPSNAEKRRSLTRGEIRKYKALIYSGLIGLVSVLAVLIGLIFEWIPEKGDNHVWAFSYILFGFLIYTVIFTIGFTKGRDHRPGIIEMLAAGGRR